MKKSVLIIVLLIFNTIVFSQQGPTINSVLPEIIPPSPTMAGLMKFEEVPVSNYTGVPSISIPLFTSPTISKDISIACDLQYHTSSIAVGEVAGDLGLGWSFTASGSVSRTVRCLPDELLDKWTRIGIYYDDVSNNSNHYYESEKYIQDLIPHGEYFDEFLFDAQKGKYDTEHDLYQFNFLGKTGRFLIKKVPGQNQLKVVHLDQGTEKVMLNYIYNQNTGFSLNGFVIYDDKGYKYNFDKLEYTTKTGLTESINFDNSIETTPNENYNYISSFHLTSIYNQNNILLVNYNYISSEEIVHSVGYTTTSTDFDYENHPHFTEYNSNHWVENIKSLGPKSVLNNDSRIIQTQKVSSILINGFSKINFEYEIGRTDSNIVNGNTAKKLKRIFFNDWNDNLIKSYVFNYNYRTHTFAEGPFSRMFLNEIEYYSKENRTEKHQLFYKDNATNGMFVSRDYWGYMNLKPAQSPYLRTTDPIFCTTDVLEKIIYPSGGVRVFDFESNTYSFIGADSVTNFDENPNNWIETTSNFYLTSNGGSGNCINITPRFNVVPVGVEYILTIEVDFNGYDENLISIKKNGQLITGIGCNYLTDSCSTSLTLFGGDNIELCYNILNGIGNASIGGIIKYKKQRENPDQYLFGGGVRIKRILNFNNIQESINLTNPLTKVLYDYSLEESNNKSSGSLVFPKPKFEYSQSKKHLVRYGLLNSHNVDIFENYFTYRTITNNLSAVKTSGADVGYKNVKIFEGDNNGYKSYTYKSPIDHPEFFGEMNVNYPFLPVKNFDYKRGHLLEEKIFDNQKILRKTIYQYSFDNESLISSGIRLFNNFPCPFFSNYSNYHSYQSTLNYCTSNGVCIYAETGSSYLNLESNLVCGSVTSFIQYELIEEAVGWAKLINKTVKEYFYDQGVNEPNIVETKESFTYNPTNKKVSEYTITNSTNGINKTKYYYHNGNSIHSDNRIAEIQKIEKFKDGQLLETANINYANSFAGNVSYLPANITVSKGQLSLEQDLVYLLYDENSNPLCVSKTNGTLISYIWGYNKTLPVAKLENIAYTNIPANLIANIQALTSSPTATDAEIITALNALRSSTDVNMQKAMITTFTYKPLVGVTSVTDPKGDFTTYVYDDFNRLMEVRDRYNNLISEHEYHYKTQN